MRTRVAQIRRKTDYLRGAISRLTLAKGVFFDGARIDNKAINGCGAILCGETKAKREEKFNIYRGDNGFYNLL